MFSRSPTSRSQLVFLLTLGLAWGLATACSTQGSGAAASQRRAARAAQAPSRPDRANAVRHREAEARRIAALTEWEPGHAARHAGIAYNPHADPSAVHDDLFPDPVHRARKRPALYEPIGDRMLHFAGTMLKQDEELVEYEAELGEDMVPAGLAAWITLEGPRGWKVDRHQLMKALEMCRASGGLLNLAISFRAEARGHDPAMDLAVATTSDWDERIDEIADLIRESGVRVLLRIGNEINGWQGNHPYVFPAAYRKIVHRFRERGADNVAFVWCVVPHGDADIFGVNEAGEDRWFPGEDVVDWYSINLFDRLHFSSMAGRGREGADRFSSVTDQLLNRARRVGKPVLIGECTPQRMDVVSAREDPRGERGDTVWHQWFIPFLAFLDVHPEIKAVTMLPVDWRKTSAWADWGDARIHRNPAIMSRWRDELSGRRWMHLPDVLGDTEGVLGARAEDPETSHESSGRDHGRAPR